MKFPKQAELELLVSKIQNQEALSAEELQAFTQLNAELSSWKTDCVKVVDDIVQQIVTYGITLDQLTTRAELRHWAAPVAAPVARVEADENRKERRQRTPNPELVIFRIQPPGAKGAATLIHRNELPPRLGAKLQWLLQQEGELKDKLQACIDSKQAEEYLANEEGQLFLEKLLNWIRSQAV